jgi:hypothetical protein
LYEERSKMPETGVNQVATGWSRSRPIVDEFATAQNRWLPVALYGLALVLWGASLFRVDLRGMTDIGLLAVLPVTYYLALLLLTVSFAWVVFRQTNRRLLMFLHVLALTLIIHGTPSILYGTLRYSWAWKHVGMVDFIMRYGRVDPSQPILTAYHNWPGFFALNAFLTQAAGLSTPLDYARWAPVLFNMLFAGALFLIYTALTDDRRLVWMGIWIFGLANWIGQDYFAPQAFSYLLYLAIMGILLHWFRRPALATAPVSANNRKRAPNFIQRALAQDNYDRVVIEGLTPGLRVLAMALVILMMAVITFTHQLTPFILVLGLAALALFRRIYPTSLPVLMLVMTVSWVLFVTAGYIVEHLTYFMASFGTFEENVSQSLLDLSRASSGQILVSWMSRGLTALVIFLAAAGFFAALVRGRVHLTAALLVLVPFPMLFANAYGGEALFRIYFFALPGLALLIALLFFPSRQAGRSSWAVLPAVVVTGALLVAFLFAYYGKDRHYYFTAEEVSVTEFLYQNAPQGSLIIEGTRNYPAQWLNYERFTYVPISREPWENRERLLANPAEVLEDWMSNPRYSASYLLITRIQKAEIDMLGDLPPGALDQIEQALLQSGRFLVLYSNQDAAIYILKLESAQ